MKNTHKGNRSGGGKSTLNLLGKPLAILATAVVILANGLFVSGAHATAVIGPALGVTQISAVQTYATADGSFENGWRWVFDVTVPENETILKMKFADWTSGSNTIVAANHIRFYSAQSSNALNAEDALLIAATGAYSGDMNLNPDIDLDIARAGRQIQVVVEAAVPEGSAGGSYSTSYGISTNPDGIAPVITLLGVTPTTIEAGSVYEDAGATALDNVDGDISSSIGLSGTVITDTVGSYTLTYNVSDAAGNSATPVDREVIVGDTTAPVITEPEAVTVEAEGVKTDVELNEPGVSDNASGELTVSNDAPEDGFPVGTTTVTWTATDASGNSGTATQSVTVEDTTAPAITVPDGVTGEATSADGAVVAYEVSASDLVDGEVDVACVPVSGSQFALGETTVTCTAMDAAGNGTSASFTVTVEDRTSPVITLLGDDPQIIERGTGYIELGATATDAVEGDISPISINSESVNTDVVGTYGVTYDVSDSHGNVATQVTRTVEVRDTIPPTATVSYSTTDPTNESVIATLVPSEDITVTNNDGLPTKSFELNGSFTFEFVDVGGNTGTVLATVENIDKDAPVITIGEYSTAPTNQSITVSATTDGDATLNEASHEFTENGSFTFVATDDVGNVTEKTVTIENIDKGNPVIVLVGDGSVTVEAGVAYVDNGAAATDNYDADINSKIVMVNSVNTMVLGTYTVTYDVTDAAGNVADQVTRTVEVVDTTKPEISAISDITEEATSADGAAVTYTNPTAIDPVFGSVEVACSPESGSTFALGTTSVTCSADDGHGNIATETFNVTVQDTTPPTIVGVPADITGVEATSPVGAAVSYDLPTATDLVDGAVAVSCDPISGSIFALGTTPVTCSATDAHNNMVDATFTVTVGDAVAPTIVAPADVTKEATGPLTVVELGMPSVSDIVDVDPAVTNNAPASFPVGTTEVTWTATDDSGNSASEIQTVVITDETAPVITLTGANPQIIERTDAYVELGATASDIVDGSVTVLIDATAVNTQVSGTYTVTYDAMDAHSNLATQLTRTVTVRDTTPPSGTVAYHPDGPTNQNVIATLTPDEDIMESGATLSHTFRTNGSYAFTITDIAGNFGSVVASVNYIEKTAPPAPPITVSTQEQTNQDVVITISYPDDALAKEYWIGEGDIEDYTGSFSLADNATVYARYQSAASNWSNEGTLVVNNIDKVDPTITAPADIIMNDKDVTNPINLGTPTTDDNKDVASVVNNAPATFPIGQTTVVTWTVTDTAGNTATALQNVTITDTTPPTITAPADVTFKEGQTVALGTATASDNSGTVTVTNNDVLPAFPLGDTSVTWTATDGAGLTATAIQKVTITDGTAPTLTVTGFTVDGVAMTGDTESGYTLSVSGGSGSHALAFSAGSGVSEALNPEVIGLMLVPTEGQTAVLQSYYSTKPVGWQEYLNAAAAGTRPFAYIATDGTPIRLLDGAQYTLASTRTDMIVPDDFPAGTYTVSGTIEDLNGNTAIVTFTLVVEAAEPAPVVE